MQPNTSILIRIFGGQDRKDWHYLTVEVAASSDVEARNLAHEFMKLYDDHSYYEIAKITWKGR